MDLGGLSALWFWGREGHVGPSVCHPAQLLAGSPSILYDCEFPLPGQGISLVTICELGCDLVAVSSKCAFGGFLHGYQELIPLSPESEAIDPVVSFISLTAYPARELDGRHA